MKNMELLKDMGNNIKIARLKKEMTQEMLSEKCNVSTKYISELERGKCLFNNRYLQYFRCYTQLYIWKYNKKQ